MANNFIVKADISKAVYKAVSNISQYDEKTQQAIRDVVKTKTDEVYKMALQLVPMKTGKLASHIKESISNTETGTQGIVQVDDPVAHLVEFGANATVEIPFRKKALHPGADGWYMARANIPYRPAHPFIKPAMDAVRPSIETAVKEAILGGCKDSI